jgi:hypothetical protein
MGPKCNSGIASIFAGCLRKSCRRKRAAALRRSPSGSGLALGLVGALGNGLIRTPQNVILTIRNTLSDSFERLTGVKIPTSIRGLSPRSPVLIGLDKLPIKAPHHSIIGDRGRGDSPNGSDGVVPYRSAHLDSAQSEKIIPYGHSGYQSPEAIAELLRILRLDVGVKATPGGRWQQPLASAGAQQIAKSMSTATA